ncbi:ATP-dependent Lon protease pim1 [Mycoemilia scoparia]|uniref:Lon protease homolog, mitochondrial n=1 Tax=Mycoemilia scoparia TaxID=417184 RepID=A0A9W7ZTK0_9FUNG|nr:ATP-dependent Lon protease pim1 [Mycoemilia scoparia]
MSGRKGTTALLAAASTTRASYGLAGMTNATLNNSSTLSKRCIMSIRATNGSIASKNKDIASKVVATQASTTQVTGTTRQYSTTSKPRLKSSAFGGMNLQHGCIIPAVFLPLRTAMIATTTTSLRWYSQNNRINGKMLNTQSPNVYDRGSSGNQARSFTVSAYNSFYSTQLRLKDEDDGSNSPKDGKDKKKKDQKDKMDKKPKEKERSRLNPTSFFSSFGRRRGRHSELKDGANEGDDAATNTTKNKDGNVKDEDSSKGIKQDEKDTDEVDGSKPKDIAEEDSGKPATESHHKNNGTTSSSGSQRGGSPLDQLRKAVGVLESNSHKPSVPDDYPNVLALPLVRRPLFPGFYKAVVIKNPQVTAAVKELLQRGEPFVGAFMLKDDDSDVDVISNVNEVHPVGVFAQITSIFPSTNQEEESLTAVLYPHRRIRLLDVAPPPLSDGPSRKPSKSTATVAEVEGDAIKSVADQASHKDKQPSTSEAGEPSSEVENTVLDVQKQFGFTVGEIENIPDNEYDGRSQMIRAITSEIVSVFKDIAALNPLFRDQIANFSMSQSAGNVFEDPARLADFAAAVSAGESQELQDILEERHVEQRLEKALLVLKKELMNAQLQNKISKDVEAKIAKRQREFYLMEQLKGIKRELGLESDGKDKLIVQFKEKAAKLQMPEEVKKVFDEEISKLAHLEPAASEFNVTRNYLDWLTQIPWGRSSREDFDLTKSRTVLDEDHYGLEDVKDRILEFIAVGKLRGAVEGKILCFVGPPGVGKTSIGKSIARALGRGFYRFSVGGLSDVAEIKGHRRTYVGAMPGKVVQALKKVQTENPLILIDEIDKLGKSHQGDPASALLEMLDPEQNDAFLDHYMDIPIDLSRVLFVCTANVSDTIPGPLLDRMEVIRLSGYLGDEKLSIANKYLVPQAKEATGLSNSNINLTDDAIEALVKHYCRESGVRNLKKHVEKVFRKAALKVVDGGIAIEKDEDSDIANNAKGVVMDTIDGSSTLETNDSINVATQEKQDTGSVDETASSSSASTKVGDEQKEDTTPHKEASKKYISSNERRQPLYIPKEYNLDISSSNLKDYVGPPVFETDRLYDTTPPGVVMGLAWTSMGGSALYIESVVKSQINVSGSSSQNEGESNGSSIPGGSLNTTGQLGDVMKESSTLAYTYMRSYITKKYPTNKFFDISSIHLHVPEGATPKDGPSAGITMATSLLSLALDKPVRPDVAMTGELTLTGKVLKIGGLKEKTIAAKRSGVKRILFPKANMADWVELPDHVKEGIEGCPIDWYEQVPKLVGIED